MITNTKQDWSVGNTVKVGFMTLKVLGCFAVKDDMPDIYELVDERNGRRYHFIPHNGLTRIEADEELASTVVEKSIVVIPKEKPLKALWRKHNAWIERNRYDYFANIPCKYEIPYEMKRKNILIFRVVFILGLLAFLWCE